MKMIRAIDLLSTLGALTMAVTPLAAISATAHAADLSRSGVSISVGDLDFSRPADVARFDARVNAAAGALCQANGMTDLEQGSTCKTAVREEALQKLDAAQRQQMASAA